MISGTILLLIIALIWVSITSGVIIMSNNTEETADTASTDNADFVIESEKFERNRSDNGTRHVIMNSSSVNGPTNL